MNAKGLRAAIVAMSAFAVVSDAILIAFYPHFFARRYGVTSAFHVGAYIAAISIAVMCTLPLWARVARRVETMHLLLFTQGAAGTLCVLSGFADSVLGYWVLTMLMFMCKSSYLLMYPYLMRMQPPETHGHTIGLLSVVVHVGSIAGAAAGGHVLQRYGAAACIGLMAFGDFAQMAICVWLIRSGRVVHVVAADAAAAAAVASTDASPKGSRSRILPLCALMMLIDFGAYLIRPFFSMYWEQVSASNDQLISGLVFAIPGAIALAALFANQLVRTRGGRLPDPVLANLLLGAAGLALQAWPAPWAVLLGRVLYGWALFQLIVKFEVLLFRFSTPAAYARDFSVFNFFQNLGVLLSSFAAGALVERHGIAVTFAIAAAGFGLSALLDRLLGLERPATTLPEPALAETRHAG
ncbi:MAG TPA: MFS transporter [Burkholderiaceae bacterium]|nr:MFS transporter [Burkholderiaceae bacterium]